MATLDTSEKRIRLLGVSIDNCTLASALDDIGRCIEGVGAPQQFAFANADCLNRAWKFPDYHALLNRLPRVFADGSGIRWSSRLLHGYQLDDNVNGTDLFPLLCERAEREGWRIALLGAAAPVNRSLVDNLETRYPSLNVAYARDGFFNDADEAAMISDIAASGADLILVGLGAPRQEFWIDRHLDDLGVRVAIGVGGLFDFYSDRIPRAPMILRRVGMEWMWRLAQEPSRLWKRYLLGNPLFVARAIRNRKRDGR